MYELVNTSLPNGLIPGTHGFSTVALTKGTPDALRIRFEAFCAYNHRTGAHDATYFKENPVNLFHVVLPQGDHIVGRVAPVDFDYTGRTNRLAHLLVFPKGEMPAIGGASVLQKEYDRITTPWSGEARWLESDKLTLGRLRLEIPTKDIDAPAWRAMFGDGSGLNLAKGFARQLAKNMSSGGRAIYFKTSTAHDVDGTKLLALFTDLINLLPVADRQKVTFATYPVALPQGTVCHLRGVYDRDRIFDAAAATQPWVDCEKGAVHNASLLPLEEVRVRQRNSELKIMSVPVRPTQQSRMSFEARPQVAPRWLPTERNDGTKLLVIGIVVFTLILIGAFGFGVWWYLDTQNKIREPRVIDGPETKDISPTNVTDETQNKIPTDTPPSKDEGKSDDVNQQKGKGKTNDITVNNRKGADVSEVTEENTRQEKEAKERQMADEKKRKDDEEKRKVAFVDATMVTNLEHNIKDEYSEREKKAMTNGTLRVFYYDQGILTNVPAGFIASKVSRSSIEIKPTPKELAGKTSGNFLIWFDPKRQVAYWDWSPLNKPDPVEWFSDNNTIKINLVDMCFGNNKQVYSKWENHCGKPRFTIGWLAADGKRLEDTLQLEGELTLQELVDREEQKQYPNELGKLKKYRAQQQKIKDQQSAYSNLVNRLSQPKKKGLGDIHKEIEKCWGLIGEAGHFGDVYLKYTNHEINGWQDLLRGLDVEINNLNDRMRNNRDSIKTMIRRRKFRVIKVEGSKK